MLPGDGEAVHQGALLDTAFKLQRRVGHLVGLRTADVGDVHEQEVAVDLDDPSGPSLLVDESLQRCIRAERHLDVPRREGVREHAEEPCPAVRGQRRKTIQDDRREIGDDLFWLSGRSLLFDLLLERRQEVLGRHRDPVVRHLDGSHFLQDRDEHAGLHRQDAVDGHAPAETPIFLHLLRGDREVREPCRITHPPPGGEVLHLRGRDHHVRDLPVRVVDIVGTPVGHATVLHGQEAVGPGKSAGRPQFAGILEEHEVTVRPIGSQESASKDGTCFPPVNRSLEFRKMLFELCELVPIIEWDVLGVHAFQ